VNQSICVSPTSRGFTLLELVIAMAIFSIMSIIAYSGLNNVLTARERTDEQAAQLVKLQLAFTYMARDISQTANRGIRDEYGEFQAALVGRDIDGYLIELTRTGWRNPIPQEQRPRSSLQRVGYKIEDEKLIRATWSVLDRDQDGQVIEKEMLDNVSKLEFNFLDKKDNKKWYTSWPQSQAGSQTPDTSPPRAVKVIMETKYFGTLERLFVIPSQSKPKAKT